MANNEIPSDKREFRCNHCNGKILIPRDLAPTTGPCPHCSGVITSPAPESAAPAPFPPAISITVPVPQAPAIVPAAPPPPAPLASQAVPPPAPVQTPMPQVPVQSAVSPPPAPVAPNPETVQSSAAPVATPPPAPAKLEPAVIPPRRDAASASEKPAAAVAPAPIVEIPHAADPSQANKRKHKAAPAAKERKNKSGLIPAMLVLFVLICGAGVAVFFVSNEMGRNIPPPALSTAIADPAAKEANYIRLGWQKDAYQLLRDYMAATTSKEKLPFILKGDELAGHLDEFYGGGVINDTDTPADAFSVYELSEEDRKRGLFMMIYDQPPQFEMKEFFRPLASLEVQYGVDEADLLLSTLARVGNFAMEPLRVHAFFKRTPEGLKLDWEIFAQTKYRTFENFVELPDPNQIGVFRVFIVEDVPDKGRLEAGTRTYRITDPANTGDSARVNVKVDSEIGRALSIINWRGTKESRPITRTATVELKWAGEGSSPELEINRFLCWEFIGLGGQETPATASTK
jgi:hypothetical protein